MWVSGVIKHIVPSIAQIKLCKERHSKQRTQKKKKKTKKKKIHPWATKHSIGKRGRTL